MSLSTQEDMFTLTPPPSEFDEVDKNALLTCSPSLTGFTYPSPAPSHSGHGSSSDSLNICQDDMSFSDSQRASSHDIFFGDSSTASFLPISTVPEQDMAQFTATTNAYPIFQQTSWLPFSSYTHQTPISSYEQPSTSVYPAFENSMPPSYANVIPPTPQDIAPVSLDFNTLPHASSQHQHLSASPSFSQHSSHQSSLSSMSRSPSPALYQMGGGGGTSMRPTLRSSSTSSNSSLHAYGIPVTDSSSGSSQPAWRCAYPGCTSRATFTRGCDLRKHYNRHSKHLFCRVDGCQQSQAAAATRSTDGILTGGFSSKKDRARHEAKHNPGIKCEWKGPSGEDCGRIFSRMDNMKDHVRRIHKKQEQKTSRS